MVTSFRIMIITKRGDNIYDAQFGEGISDDCLEHVATILAGFATRKAPDPKLLFDLDAGEFSIAVSTCSSYYFVSIVPSLEKETIKSLNRLISIFLGHSISMHEEEHGPLPKPESYLIISETLFEDFDKELDSFYNIEKTHYLCFIVDQNILYSKGKIPFHGNEYFQAIADLTDLAEVCLYEPFGIFKSRKDLFVLPYFKHLQIGYFNKEPIDDDLDMVDDFKIRLSVTKFTIPYVFCKREDEDEDEEEDDQIN